MNLLRYAGIALVALCLQAGPGRADEISGAGSTFVASVLSKWSADYRAKGGSGLDYQAIGSGGGIAALRSGIVDFAASDAPLRPADLQRSGLLQFPLVVGGVVAIFNIDGVRANELRLTGALLADIFSGKVTRWNDARIAELNPALRLPAASIIVAHRVDGSGTTFNWTNYLSKASADWRTHVGEGLSVRWPVGVGGRGNDGVAAFVKQTKNSIGYVEFANARRSRLAYALVQNKAGQYVAPGAKAFAAAAANADWGSAQDFHVVITDPGSEDAYPIAATSFALMFASPRVASRTKAAVEFFRWSLQHGQDQATALGLVPLPPEVVSRIEAYWRARFTDGQ